MSEQRSNIDNSSGSACGPVRSQEVAAGDVTASGTPKAVHKSAHSHTIKVSEVEELAKALQDLYELTLRLIDPENTSYYELTAARAALKKVGYYRSDEPRDEV